jgi:hypothetical protein
MTCEWLFGREQVRTLALSGSGFVFPNRPSSNVNFLLQVRQDGLELGVIFEDIQDGVVEPEWQV